MILSLLNQFSKSRTAWSLLLLFTLAFEGIALFFQHVMTLQPCVMCIYERLAMLGMAGAAIIGLINPQHILIRWAGLLAWGYTSFTGFQLARQHVEYQLHPSPFAMCDAFVHLPSWAPLNQWMPWMFEAYGDCSQIVWEFLSFSMPQWLIIIFGLNLLACGLFILAQFFNRTLPKKGF